jgi:hypothetical protein
MKINHFTYINSKGVYYNSQKNSSSDPLVLEAIYDLIQPNYPKFYKMDPLSQLGFLLAEELLRGIETNKPDGIIVWNKHSSYWADIRHVDNMSKNVSGPANFTYTLPNIVIGEIAIRHQLLGESGVFITDGLDLTEMATTTQLYLNTSPNKRMVICWLDAGPECPMGFMCDVMGDTPNIDIFTTEIASIYKGLF